MIKTMKKIFLSVTLVVAVTHAQDVDGHGYCAKCDLADGARYVGASFSRQVLQTVA